MKKRRRYLKDLIAIDINRLVLETGYFEIQIGDILLSLAPERCPGKGYIVSLFTNHLRQHKFWELSAKPHNGRLRNGGSIPYRSDETFYVIGSDGRRYRHLFIDPEEMRIGVRSDFYPHHWQAYPRGKAKENGVPTKDAIEKINRELFGLDEFTEDYQKRLRTSYLPR